MKKILLSIVLSIVSIPAFSQCAPATASMYLDVNNVHARIMNGGDMWWDLLGTAKYEVPYGGGANALFAGALWIGGLDQNNELHVAAQTYRQNGNDYFPGPLDVNGNVTQDVCNDFDDIWKVYGSQIDEVIDEWQLLNPSGTTSNPISVSDVPVNVLQWPAKGNPYNTIVGQLDLAPFYDRDGDGNYDPTNGDYPILGNYWNNLYADQMIFWVFNDNGNTHTQSNGTPLKIEVHALAYAFSTADCLNDQTFYHYTIINRSQNIYHELYAGFFVDPDLGCPADDFIGCDTLSNMGIAYNADPLDQDCGSGGSYGDQPPLVGIKILHGISFPILLNVQCHTVCTLIVILRQQAVLKTRGIITII
jgi:hypothetical protein